MNKTGNSYRIDEQYIINRISARGSRAITGDNFGDEISHGAFDANSSKQFIEINGKIGYGNNGDFWGWDDYEKRAILSSKPGSLSNSTSYWGRGTTKETWWLDGCPKHTLHWHTTTNKFYVRIWEYDIQINDEDYLRKKGNERLADGGCTIVEYEISEEQYDDYLKDYNFDEGFRPTTFVELRRFKDSEINYNQNNIVESINIAMMSYNGKMNTTCVVNGKSVQSRQLYWPQVKPLGESFVPMWNFRELNKVESNYDIVGGKFDVYLIQILTKGDEKIKESDDLYNATNNGKDIIKINGRGKNPRQVWINQKGTTLSTYDVYSKITDKQKDLSYDTIMIFHQTGGDYEFPTIKTELPTDTVLNQVAQLHIDKVKENKKLQYSSKKAEDGKVDVDKENLCNENGDMTIKYGLTESIEFITEDNLTKKEIRNPDNHEIRETQKDGRNYDWLIKKETDFIFHAEYMNGTEDWEHIDQTTFKILSKMAPYNVLVVDNFSPSSKKLSEWKRILEDNNIQSTVYVVERNDFVKGFTNKFKKLI